MNSKNVRMITGLALLLGVNIVGTIFPVFGAAKQSESQARKIEGTWRVHVAIRNCQSLAVLRTFPAMLTFAQGGTLTETTTGFSPAQRTPGHGVWRRTGDHSFSTISEAFLFDPSGSWIGTQRLTQTLEIGENPSQLTSRATNQIFDANGSVTLTGCATAVATRIE